ncbi:MAG TPA: CRISPR-associated CARF protein Csx1 [Syntrophorhabdaceae bacterium]|nr:CRISPR-associated CARF protein Csx1 [Syntrophorhabdaceae bacterium]
MVNYFIYQIGRLDVNAFKGLDFIVNDKTFKTSLSSFAIRDYYGEGYKKSSIVLVYPVSLPFNQFILKNRDFISSISETFKNGIEHALNNPHDYLNNPHQLFVEHPHSKQADYFFIIHSLGTYTTNKQQVKFSSHYTDILLEILFDMVMRYIQHIKSSNQDGKVGFFIDISSGLNIYITALLEAARYLGVLMQLAGIYNRDKVPEVIIAFSDPILPNENISYTIHFDPVRTKAFYSSAISNKDIENFNLSRAIYKNEREEKRKLQEILESFLITYSAIKNNTPLAIYQFGYIEKDTILEIMKDFIEKTQKKLYDSFESSPGFKKDDYLKVLLTFGFYYGIANLLEKNGIKQHNNHGIKLDELRTSFKNVYDTFGLGLNDVILGNEIDLIDKANKEIVEDYKNEWRQLFYLLNPNKNAMDTEPKKRNYFAHGGFEQNVTQYRIKNGSLTLKYDDKNTDMIKRWLKESG